MIFSARNLFLVVLLFAMPSTFSTLKNSELDRNGKNITPKKREAVRPLTKGVIKKLKTLEKRREKVAKCREKKERVRKELKKQYEVKYLNNAQKQATIDEFEARTKSIKHEVCDSCCSVGISLKMSKTDKLCKRCMEKGLDRKGCLRERLLPVWYETEQDSKLLRNPQYDLPIELKELSDAEKMLIQKYSVYVPLHHIKKGVLGFKGHVCCFPQQLESVCKTLPRLPEEVSTVKLIKTYTNSSGITANRVFTVRKTKVLAALRWLKTHNPEYADIEIAEERLNWMGNATEMELPSTVEHAESAEVSEQSQWSILCRKHPDTLSLPFRR